MAKANYSAATVTVLENECDGGINTWHCFAPSAWQYAMLEFVLMIGKWTAGYAPEAT